MQPHVNLLSVAGQSPGVCGQREGANTLYCWRTFFHGVGKPFQLRRALLLLVKCTTIIRDLHLDHLLSTRSSAINATPIPIRISSAFLWCRRPQRTHCVADLFLLPESANRWPPLVCHAVLLPFLNQSKDRTSPPTPHAEGLTRSASIISKNISLQTPLLTCFT